MRNQKQWQVLAERRARRFLRIVQEMGRRQTGLKLKTLCLIPHWNLGVKMVGRPRMRTLNAHHRGKDEVTDVLSFPAPQFFQKLGSLGDLVVCLPRMKEQARDLGHLPEVELDVLLIHGILHVLGFDHEKGRVQAAEMAHWEAKILLKSQSRSGLRLAKGLIDRANSGTEEA